MRFSVVNLGCKVNRVESDSYENLFFKHGLEAAGENADLVVVNTCTVTGEAEKKTRKAVRQALKRHPFALVVVTGCAVAINPAVFTNMDERVRIVGKAEAFAFLEGILTGADGSAQMLRSLRSIIGPAFSVKELSVSPSGFVQKLRSPHSATGADPLQPVDVVVPAFSRRARVGVKVQDGCDNACTYCIVHVARGKATSRPFEAIVSETLELASSGVREIVLSGINIGSYDYEGIRLEGLLEALLAETADTAGNQEGPVRFRVSSIEPMDVSDDFIRLMARSQGRICRHLHLPLQSGSSKVLRDMARPYDAQDFSQLVDFIRAEVPEISLTTDIIVGFPGETEEDFQDTLDLARSCGFSKIHVFPYSKREGTPAAERPDQIQPELKAARAATLRALSDELRSSDYASREGAKELVLVEQPGIAMSESYYEIAVSESFEQGALVELALPSQPAPHALQ